MILLELEPRDLMMALQVNKAFRAGVTGSSKLQIKLCYRGDPKSIWRSNFDGDLRYESRNEPMIPPFSCSLSRSRRAPRSSEVNEEIEIHARLRISDGWAFSGGRFPLVPTKYNSMLICQPPLTEMVATPSCCTSFVQYRQRYPEHIPEPQPPIAFNSPSGLTVGNLLYVARRLYAHNQYCPYANERFHDKQGEVHPDVDFTGSMSLNASDPATQVLSWDDYYSQGGKSPDDYTKREEKQPIDVERYCAAKKYGK